LRYVGGLVDARAKVEIEVKAFVPVGQIQSDKTKGRRRRDGEPPAFFDLFGN
jgi:hypothetical protein